MFFGNHRTDAAQTHVLNSDRYSDVTRHFVEGKVCRHFRRVASGMAWRSHDRARVRCLSRPRSCLRPSESGAGVIFVFFLRQRFLRSPAHQYRK